MAGLSVVSIPVSAGATAPVRLTARGRFVVRALVWLAAVVVLTVAVGLAVLLGGGRAEGGERSRPLPVTYHVVAPGETLWGLAERIAPGVDPRDTVAEIVESNGLASANVRVGTRLALPVAP
jgi:hypothetical protein